MAKGLSCVSLCFCLPKGKMETLSTKSPHHSRGLVPDSREEVRTDVQVKMTSVAINRDSPLKLQGSSFSLLSSDSAKRPVLSMPCPTLSVSECATPFPVIQAEILQVK